MTLTKKRTFAINPNTSDFGQQLASADYGISIYIGKVRLDHFTSFTVTKSISNFVDTFSVNFSNPGGRYSTKFSIGTIVTFIKDGVVFFKGLIEDKKVNYSSVGSTGVLSGREEMVYLTETDADPKLGPWKNTQDNDIIKLFIDKFNWDSVGGTDNKWELDLGKGAKIKEYDISSGSKRVAQIIEEVCKFNNFVLFKDGDRLKKRALPTTNDILQNARVLSMTRDGGVNHSFMNKIMTVDINENISGCRSNTIGYTYGSGKKKYKISETRPNTYIKDGSYGRRLRTLGELTGLPLDRTRYVAVSAKDAAELKEKVRGEVIATDIQCSVDMLLAGIEEFTMLEVVKIGIESEDILQYMYVDSITYSMDTSNKTITKVIFKPLIKIV